MVIRPAFGVECSVGSTGRGDDCKVVLFPKWDSRQVFLRARGECNLL